VPTSTITPFFTGQMPFLPPSQQHQSTEGKKAIKPVNTFCLLKLPSEVTMQIGWQQFRRLLNDAASDWPDTETLSDNDFCQT